MAPLRQQLCLLTILASVALVTMAAKPGKKGQKAAEDSGVRGAIREKYQEEKAKEMSKWSKSTENSRTKWEIGFCQKVIKLMKQKDYVIRKIEQMAGMTWIDHSISEPERDFQMATFRLFAKELNETENMIIQSLMWLETSLKGDFKNLASLKESSKARLDGLRDATLKEEREYNYILKAEVNHVSYRKIKILVGLAAVVHVAVNTW